MPWFVRRPRRLAHERQALESLLQEGWVHAVHWLIDEQAGTAHVDIDFEGGKQLRQARIEYPFIYPFAPPRLVPREPGQRWSNHQWGTSELCLQIRADNWIKSLDGAAVLRSARHLLDTESTVDANGRKAVVPSEHRFTEGQLLRWEYARLVLSDELLAEVRRREPGVWVLDLRASFFENSCVSLAVGISGSAQYDRWADPTIPCSVGQSLNGVGRIAILEPGDLRHHALTLPDMASADRWAAFSSIPFDGGGIVVGLLEGRVIAKFLGKDHRIHDIIKILMDKQQRAPTRNAILATKRVAILGCGSMGSKVATSLARSGVRSFFLVDADVLKVGNLARNDLDWGEVGAHKVDGLTARLKRICEQVKVDRWVNQLGGQTTVDALNACLASLKTCDLIVETTGSGQGFVYASSVSESEGVPMVWGRVFGGGFGGYIARSRPGIEASPLDIRNFIYHWFQTPGFPEPPADVGINYAADPDDQAPMIADDADVSVISSHLTGFAADALRGQESSDYPHSVYVIGLRKEWLFEQPFETRPLDVSGVKTTHIAEDNDAEGCVRTDEAST
ncbi:ThiF family adenylyltransferase [Cupriavidus sp. AcVe19-6a]|uniref:ThiF family adenylyltransferase n=1 Tax=Cupriavidus sp. AcVe19-6a TaxID=2821358 RepID=UPI001AE6480F|nr:ThiF family adenylyltransferase [Cupriavidus sp. AcVe19-6a]MBP0639867.1 ThiF family adenylyltransferase [Cupriavidus sp. AcVe19-6a]